MPSKMLLWLAAVLMAVVSCSEPSAYENFVKVSDVDSLGRYHFTLSMTDSLSQYDIYFYTRIDATPKEFDSIVNIPVNVLLVSPSGAGYEETVSIPKEIHDDNSLSSKDYEVAYRTGCVPVAFGKWELYLSSGKEIPGLRGFGVKLYKCR